MPNIEDIKNTITDIGADLGDKARRLSGSAKLQYDLMNKNNEIKRMYAQLGERYYKDHVGEDDEDIAEITVLLREAEEMKKEIEELKEKGES